MEKNCSIIIPAYNEESGINPVIDGIRKVMDSSGWKYELIVVDDGSTDSTAEKAEKKQVKLIRHERNRGYGASLKTGIVNAIYENILITDADGTYPPEYITGILKEEGYAMVVGARKAYQVSITRRPVKYLMNRFASYLSGVKIPDLNSGLRLFKKEIAEKYISYMPDGFSFTSNITLVMLCNNYPVKYIQIDYYKREGKSKFHPIKDTFNLGSFIVRTTLYFNPLKIFFPASVLMMLLSFFVLFYSYMVLKDVMEITVIMLFISSIQVLAIGLLADLINKKTR